MNRTIFTAALIASTVPAVVLAENANESVLAEAKAYFEKGEALTQKLVELVEGVHDLASADAAAEGIIDILEGEADNGIPEWEQLDAATQAAVQKMAEESIKRTEAQMDWFNQQIERLGKLNPSFYGSEKLQRFFEDTEEDYAAACLAVMKDELSRLEPVAKGVHDKATADAHAKQLAKCTYALFLNLTSDDAASIKREDKQDIVERLKNVEHAMRNATPAYYGSEALEQAMWGARNLLQPMSREMLHAVMTNLQCTNSAAAGLEDAKKAFESITDAASAEAAESEVWYAVSVLSNIFCYSDQPAMEAWLALCSPVTRRSALDTLRPLAQGIIERDPECFGHAELKAALEKLLSLPEKPVTPEEFARYTSDWQKLAQLSAKMLEVARSAKDAESADAAATELSRLTDEFQCLHTQLKQIPLPMEVANTINSSAWFEGIFASGMELSTEKRRLLKLTPSFYGSKALEDAMNGL